MSEIEVLNLIKNELVQALKFMKVIKKDCLDLCLCTEPRMTRSSSLRRANSLRRTNNKTQAQQASQNQSTPLTRSGTGGSLERNSRRTTFSGNRKYKSRDLNVTVSRGIQTNLTKDPMEDLPNNNIQTK